MEDYTVKEMTMFFTSSSRDKKRKKNSIIKIEFFFLFLHIFVFVTNNMARRKKYESNRNDKKDRWFG